MRDRLPALLGAVVGLAWTVFIVIPLAVAGWDAITRFWGFQ